MVDDVAPIVGALEDLLAEALLLRVLLLPGERLQDEVLAVARLIVRLVAGLNAALG